MRHSLLVAVMMILCMFFVFGCEETEESVDDENDIIVRNLSEFELWIEIDGSQRGHIDDDGIARTMWDDIPDGVHELRAYYEGTYTSLHCQVTTGYLNEGEDFRWYLEKDHEYDGTKEGDC
ncbi:hypothetical protein JXA40_09795 [bacterium]|nr:hypothetical protein [candidate division CSSED10-310 bacterium]